MDLLDTLLEKAVDSSSTKTGASEDLKDKKGDSTSANVEEAEGAEGAEEAGAGASVSASASSTVLSETTPHWAEFSQADPWADALKPALRLAEGPWGEGGAEGEGPWGEGPWGEGEAEGEWDEGEGVLDDPTVEAGLSFPSPCPVLWTYSLNKLQLSGKNLVNIAKIGDYRYLQYVDVSRNRLRDLDGLDNLPFLMHVDASHNELPLVLPFVAPLNLTYADFSYNQISFIDDLTDFWSLMRLNLSHNNIATIEGLQNLRYLRVLDLSFNKIKRFENLNYLRLTHIYLQNNEVSEFDEGEENGTKTLGCLLCINLDNNQLKSLAIFEESTSLQNVSVVGNQINEIFEMEYLKSSLTLKELNLLKNPVTEWPEYRGMVISTVPSLRVLDGVPVVSEEKVSAKNTFDPDIRFLAARNYALLSLMEQLNNPNIDPFVIPVDEPPLPIIVLVGPVGSMKSNLARYIANKYPHKVSLAVSHTSRKKNFDEVDGYHYHFVTRDEMNELAHSGTFVSYSEILGDSYGLARTELIKSFESKALCICHMDLVGAIAMCNRRLKAHLVLVISQSEEIHKERVLRKPYITQRCTEDVCQKSSKVDEQKQNTAAYIQSLFTGSFLYDLSEKSKLQKKEENELEILKENTMQYIAAMISDATMRQLHFKDKKREALEHNLLQEDTIEYISSLIAESILKDSLEESEDNDMQNQEEGWVPNKSKRDTTKYIRHLIKDIFPKASLQEKGTNTKGTEKVAGGVDTVQFIQSMIKDSFLGKIVQDPKERYSKEEDVPHFIGTMIRNTILKFITEGSKDPKSKEQDTPDFIKSMIKDAFLKYFEEVSEKGKMVCQCLNQPIEEPCGDEECREEEERGEEQLEEEKLSTESIHYIESLLDKQLQRVVAGERPHHRKATDEKREELLSKLPMSEKEYIALGAVFTDSFLIGTAEPKPRGSIINEAVENALREHPEVAHLQRETITQLINDLTDKAMEGIKERRERKKPVKVPKKRRCQACDYAQFCVKLILESRQAYFKLCNQKKEFYSSIVYTDDTKEACKLLTKIVKEVYLSQNSHMAPVFLEEHEKFRISNPDRLQYFMDEIQKHYNVYEEEKAISQVCQK